MKVAFKTFLMFAVVAGSLMGCQKSDENNSGGGQSANQPPVQAPPTNVPVAPYDNQGGPSIQNPNIHSAVMNKVFSIYNSDGLMLPDCDTKRYVNTVCYEGTKKPLREMTIASNMGYLFCMGRTQGNFVQAYARYNMDICRPPARKTYNTKNHLKQQCVAQTYDDKHPVETEFLFDSNGQLSFRARIAGQDYEAINIPYRYNHRIKELQILEFKARGSSAEFPELVVTAAQGIQVQRNLQKSPRINLKLIDVIRLNKSVDHVDSQVAGFSFDHELMFILKKQTQNPQPVPATPNGTYLPNQPGQPVPGFPNVNSNKNLIIGGNALLFPVELLNALDGATVPGLPGSPRRIPTDDFDI